MRTLKLTLALSLLPAVSLPAGITLKENGRNLKVMVDGKLFTEFHGDTRVPCLYPLMSPSGTHLTRQYPFVKGVPGEKSDHPHHTGFWFTHGNVNGHDFWHKDDCKIVTRSVAVLAAGKGQDSETVSFTAELAWEGPRTSAVTSVFPAANLTDPSTLPLPTHAIPKSDRVGLNSMGSLPSVLSRTTLPSSTSIIAGRWCARWWCPLLSIVLETQEIWSANVRSSLDVLV